MIILGVLSACWNMLMLFYALKVQLRSPRRISVFLITLLWPIISFIEAIVYWRIRRKNYCRQDSWTHVLLLGFAIFFLPVIRPFLIAFMKMHIGERGFLKMENAVNDGLFILFWILIIIAHIFFVRVLRKHFFKKMLLERTPVI